MNFSITHNQKNRSLKNTQCIVHVTTPLLLARLAHKIASVRVRSPRWTVRAIAQVRHDARIAASAENDCTKDRAKKRFSCLEEYSSIVCHGALVERRMRAKEQ